MDIASRLRQYMEAKEIASSQFADTAEIPRPTLSQLLNGRNKKISNELIGKIHDAYPSLNVMWLMFGEGDMETVVNIKTSQPQKTLDFTTQDIQEPKYEDVFIAQAPDYSEQSRNNNKTSEAYSPSHAGNTPTTDERHLSSEAMQALNNFSARGSDSARVQQIMVLYTDGRFETFRPAEPQL